MTPEAVSSRGTGPRTRGTAMGTALRLVAAASPTPGQPSWLLSARWVGDAQVDRLETRAPGLLPSEEGVPAEAVVRGGQVPVPPGCHPSHMWWVALHLQDVLQALWSPPSRCQGQCPLPSCDNQQCLQTLQMSPELRTMDINGITQYRCFHIMPSFAHHVFLRFFLYFECTPNSFFIVEEYSIVRICHKLPPRSPVAGHLGCFLFLASMSKVTISIQV